MGLLSAITSAAGGGLIKSVTDAVSTFVETPDEKNAHELKLKVLAMQPLLDQLAINEEQAKHSSVFVAGARPATMWLCALCMGGIVAAGLFGWWTGRDVSDLFLLYGSTVAPVHLGLLGLRSYERSIGKERNSVKGPKT